MRNPDEEKLVQAGNIARSCLDIAEDLIAKDVSMKHVLQVIENKIEEENAKPAFPPQISLNETAAHFYPGKEDVTFDQGDICKVDVGVSIDGYLADTARTVVVGKHPLRKAVHTVLKNVLQEVKPGIEIGYVGKIIARETKKQGFQPVTNLTGHGLDRHDAHVPPTIPNYDNGNTSKLEPGMLIAIEPFITEGNGSVYHSGKPTVFEEAEEHKVRDRIARPIYKEIKTYEGLPFASQWLANTFGWGKTKYALRKLEQQGVIKGHPPLVEESGGLVSQAEHTVLIREDDVLITTQ